MIALHIGFNIKSYEVYNHSKLKTRKLTGRFLRTKVGNARRDQLSSVRPSVTLCDCTKTKQAIGSRNLYCQLCERLKTRT